jgi:hypothetical protein
LIRVGKYPPIAGRALQRSVSWLSSRLSDRILIRLTTRSNSPADHPEGFFLIVVFEPQMRGCLQPPEARATAGGSTGLGDFAGASVA